MTTPFESQAKELLLVIVGRHKGEKIVEAAKKAGAYGATLSLGRNLSENRLLSFLSLNDVQHDVVYILLGEEKPRIMEAITNLAQKSPKKYGGWALTMHADQWFWHGQEHVKSQVEKKMNSTHKMITVIINHGFAEEAMTQARLAGATGGTILNARGTGKAEDIKFFGISLVPEKEMLLIIAPEDKVSDIVKSISQIPKLCQPGGGIIFTTDVSEFIVLGQQ